MSKRKDIIDGADAKGKRYGLIYTKKCGWVDLGHAYPDSAANLWHKINTELGTDDGDFFIVEYRQRMGTKKLGLEAYVGVRKQFKIKKGLPIDKKRAITLGIILHVSELFESMQANWFFSKITDSGFSSEDLISNLIGFYRAIFPGVDYISICEPVSKEKAIAIWDKFGAVGSLKNRTISPYVFPTNENDLSGAKKVQLPAKLNIIKPALNGDDYHEIN